MLFHISNFHFVAGLAGRRPAGRQPDENITQPVRPDGNIPQPVLKRCRVDTRGAKRRATDVARVLYESLYELPL